MAKTYPPSKAHHPHIPHPSYFHVRKHLTTSRLVQWNDKLIEWLSTNVLASRAMFLAAFILPIFVLPLPIRIQMMLTIVSSTWIQWWALPGIQRLQVKADAKRDANADATFAAQTHIANVLDELGLDIKNIRGQVELANQQIMYRRYDT